MDLLNFEKIERMHQKFKQFLFGICISLAQSSLMGDCCVAILLFFSSMSISANRPSYYSTKVEWYSVHNNIIIYFLDRANSLSEMFDWVALASVAVANIRAFLRFLQNVWNMVRSRLVCGIARTYRIYAYYVVDVEISFFHRVVWMSWCHK